MKNLKSIKSKTITINSGFSPISIGHSISHPISHHISQSHMGIGGSIGGAIGSVNAFNYGISSNILRSLGNAQTSPFELIQKFKDKNKNLLMYYMKDGHSSFEKQQQEIIKENLKEFLNNIPERFNFSHIPKPEYKTIKEISFDKFMKQKEKQNLKDYRKYLKIKNRVPNIDSPDLKDKLNFITNILKLRLPINFSEVYYSEYLKLDIVETELETEFKVNNFYKTLTKYEEVEKYLIFLKKEVAEVESADVEMTKETLNNMKKIVLEGLNIEIQIVEKYALNLKLNENMETKFKEKTLKI